MSRAYIPLRLRQRVAQQARFRCGYCLTQETVIGMPMELDHILPEALGGLSDEANLWLACPLCNAHKADRISASDPLTGATIRLFHPRQQRWHEHFAWSERADLIVGLSATGRATVLALQLNRIALVRARRLWAQAGWHPPYD